MSINKARVNQNLHIKPLHRGWLIQDPNPFDESYIWEPKRKRPVLKRKIATIEAKSYFGYHGLFKPSVAEVIDSIPNELLDQVDYFQIANKKMEGGMEIAGANYSVLIRDDHHVFKVDLFRKLIRRKKRCPTSN